MSDLDYQTLGIRDLQLLAEAGDKTAQIRLSDKYRRGIDVEENAARADVLAVAAGKHKELTPGRLLAVFSKSMSEEQEFGMPLNRALAAPPAPFIS